MLLTCCLHSAKIEIKKEKTEQKKGFLPHFMQKWQKEWERTEIREKKLRFFYPFWIAQRNQNQGGNEK